MAACLYESATNRLEFTNMFHANSKDEARDRSLKKAASVLRASTHPTPAYLGLLKACVYSTTTYYYNMVL